MPYFLPLNELRVPISDLRIPISDLRIQNALLFSKFGLVGEKREENNESLNVMFLVILVSKMRP